jgi:hypothetical protein
MGAPMKPEPKIIVSHNQYKTFAYMKEKPLPVGSQRLPCGCYHTDNSAGPIYWNQFNKVVQCHKCGATYGTMPRLPVDWNAKHPIRYRTYQDAILNRNPIHKGDGGYRKAQFEQRFIRTDGVIVAQLFSKNRNPKPL